MLSGLSGRKRKRRRRSTSVSLTNAYRFREMPLLDNSSSYKFLSLVENTMELRKIKEPECKKYFMCRIYQTTVDNFAPGDSDSTSLSSSSYGSSSSSTHDSPPKLSLHDFEFGVIDTFGVVAERTGYKLDLLATVKYYLDSALVGIMGGNCNKIFPCTQSIYRYYSSTPYGNKIPFIPLSNKK